MPLPTGEGVAPDQSIARALRKRDEELRLITSQLPCVVWSANRSLRIKHVTGAGRNTLPAALPLRPGVRLVELARCGCDDPDTPARFVAAHREALHGTPAALDVQLADRFFTVRIEPRLEVDDRVTGLIAVAVDITERKATEEQVRALQTELERVTRLNTLEGLVSGLAHELNQPLSALIGYAEVCRDRITDPATAALLEKVISQARRAGDITQRMRRLARKAPVRRGSTDVNELLREASRFLAWQAREVRVQVALELDEAVPRLSVDSVQVQQVVLNLMRNALDSLGATAPPRRLVVRSRAHPDSPEPHVEIQVEDDGPGISESTREQLLEPMFTTRDTGLGFGVPISDMIVRAHGGRLRLPEPGPGPVFSFTLPMASASW